MSLDDNNEKFRRVADSWILVTTVFLALQLSATIFTVDIIFEKNQYLELYLILSAIGVLTMGLALSVFLAVKDPRLRKYSLPDTIDKGVKTVYISVVMSSLTLGVGTYLVTNLLVGSILVSLLLVSLSSIMYGIMYRRTIHGKNID